MQSPDIFICILTGNFEMNELNFECRMKINRISLRVRISRGMEIFKMAFVVGAELFRI